ncbi:AAA family ATPase [Granulicella aggregans]
MHFFNSRKGKVLSEHGSVSPSQQPQQAESSATETSETSFVETSEHRRFVEFCDACRAYRYIGLCYGPPGVGKTLSARRYSRADSLDRYDRWDEETMPSVIFDTVLYTAEVINTPSRVAMDLSRARERLTGIAVRPIERKAEAVLEEIRLRDEARRREILEKPGCSPENRPAVDPAYFQTYQFYQARKKDVSDPTSLIVVDEADRLQMNSLEQVRSIFDSGGMILIGMPGIEKRIARFPQLYSRIGFVHEFRPLGSAEVQDLLEQRWAPPGVTLPRAAFTPEVVARLIRMTSGNLRLLTRLLTQIERVLTVNDADVISVEIVEAARDSLVIGQA